MLKYVFNLIMMYILQKMSLGVARFWLKQIDYISREKRKCERERGDGKKERERERERDKYGEAVLNRLNSREYFPVIECFLSTKSHETMKLKKESLQNIGK